jgi:hypothetical protein
VVVALADEARSLLGRRIRPGTMVAAGPARRVIVCGMGPQAAERAARQLADTGVRALAVFGIAGALDPALASGDLLCPAEILDESGIRYYADSAWNTRLRLRHPALVGSPDLLLTVREPLLDPRAKAGAHSRFGAAAVDMESAAVALVAKERGLPLLVIRAIADTAGDAIPAGLAGAVDRYGRPRMIALLLALLRQPRLLAQLPKLANAMHLANGALRSVAAASADLAWQD